jgi:hypothetical protein
MKAFFHWLYVIIDENYRASYWESVAQNEAWLKLMMELNDETEVK